jgi:hypothetical protein
MSKTKKLYELREFIGENYSKLLGRRLRKRKNAMRLVRYLKKQGREVFISGLEISI